MKKIEIKSGINLHLIPDSKFKTFSAGIMIDRMLLREEATKNAMLPLVLKRGNKNLQTAQEIAMRREELYGAAMDGDVSKRGDLQIISFFLEAVDERFIPNGKGILKDSLTLLFDTVFSPLTKDGGFLRDYVEQEKINCKDLIESIINDKRSYAKEKCIYHMCKGEPYGLCEYGFAEDLEDIDAKGLYAHYEKVIKESPIDIFVAGSFCEADVKECVMSLTESLLPRQASYPKTTLMRKPQKTNYIEEEMDITQGKLSIGFTTSMHPSHPDYYALMVYNSIFGSGAHSKLFLNVREKLSLAYYASSSLDKMKGIIMVNSGIEFENYEKARDEIFAQKDAMSRGEISKEEMEAATLSIANSLRSYKDSTRYQIAYYHNQSLLNLSVTLDEAILKIMSVTKEDVVRVAQNICADTVFFLKGGAK